jgi:uncharacterized tellurite resistance protein B-like protein
MLGLFKRVFNQTAQSSTFEEDSQERLAIATCVVLLEAATADSQFSEQESRRIISILQDRFQMTDSSVNELIEASKREREDSPGLWHFTNRINETLSIEEKYELMEMVWRVIYSDGTLDSFENYVAHKLLNLLNLDHSKFIELKLKVKNDRR